MAIQATIPQFVNRNNKHHNSYQITLIKIVAHVQILAFHGIQIPTTHTMRLKYKFIR